MSYIPPSDLKTVLHSKRANLYYLEYCRVLVNGGRVEYVTDEGKHSLYWNIPIANTTAIMLGTGTKIREFPNHGRVVDNVVSDTGANLPLPRRAGGGL